MTPVLPQVDDSPNPLQFSQVFQLIPDGGSYYVCVIPLDRPPRTGLMRLVRYNDIFRLNYA